MYSFKFWTLSEDQKVKNLKSLIEAKQCTIVPPTVKTKGHAFQEELKVAVEAMLNNAISGCVPQIKDGKKLGCYSVKSTGSGSGSGDVSIYKGSEAVKIECKMGTAQGGDLTLAYEEGSGWKFRGAASQLCPDIKRAPVQAAVCSSVGSMLKGSLGKALIERAKEINDWQKGKYGSKLFDSDDMLWPLFTLKEAWMVASKRSTLKSSYKQEIDSKEYWDSLREFMAVKGDHFVQFKNYGMYKLVDDVPFGLGNIAPSLKEKAGSAKVGGQVEVRVRPPGFSKEEEGKGVPKVEMNRGLIVKCKTTPTEGMKIFVDGKVSSSTDIHEYDVPGKKVKAKMAGNSKSQPFDYTVTKGEADGNYVATIKNLNGSPVSLGAGKWYINANINHRTAKVAVSAIIRITDKVTAGLGKSTFSLENRDDIVKMLSKLNRCK